MAGEKTEKASPKKRKDERKQGNIFKSQDIITIISLLGVFYGLKFLFPIIHESVRGFTALCFRGIETVEDAAVPGSQMVLLQLLIQYLKSSIPMLLLAVAFGILGVGIQTRFLFSMKSVAPKLNRINPLSGFKKLFSIKSVIQLIKSLIKIIILLVLIYQSIRDCMPFMVKSVSMPVTGAAAYLFQYIMSMVLKIVMWFTVVASFDFLYEWWDYERQIKMSKQELKEEYKQLEGDPQIKGRIRNLQRQRARNRMMQAVPTADVVIRNPTHFAVALKYDFDKDSAPVVVAKGKDHMALKIVEIANANHVSVIENKPLARAVYSAAEVNREIPPELYGAVAELLVYLYKLKNKKG